jgi:hypothetical protein
VNFLFYSPSRFEDTYAFSTLARNGRNSGRIVTWGRADGVSGGAIGWSATKDRRRICTVKSEGELRVDLRVRFCFGYPVTISLCAVSEDAGCVNWGYRRL